MILDDRHPQPSIGGRFRGREIAGAGAGLEGFRDSEEMGIVTQLNSSAIIAEKRGSDIYKRVRLPHDEIAPSDVKLAEMFGYWNGLRQGRRLPARSDIDPMM